MGRELSGYREPPGALGYGGKDGICRVGKDKRAASIEEGGGLPPVDSTGVPNLD